MNHIKTEHYTRISLFCGYRLSRKKPSKRSWGYLHSVHFNNCIFVINSLIVLISITHHSDVVISILQGISKHFKSNFRAAIYANRHYLEMYHDTHPERLAKNGAGKPKVNGDVFIHPTAQVHETAVVRS